MAMTLDAYLDHSGTLSAEELQEARNRALIYGGSLDTALLELELLDPAELDPTLAAARELPATPVGLLARGRGQRPWGILPSASIAACEAVPVATVDGQPWIAIHPELRAETLANLQATLPEATLGITAECWIRVIASELEGATPSPRFTSLARRYLQSLTPAMSEDLGDDLGDDLSNGAGDGTTTAEDGETGEPVAAVAPEPAPAQEEDPGAQEPAASISPEDPAHHAHHAHSTHSAADENAVIAHITSQGDPAEEPKTPATAPVAQIPALLQALLQANPHPQAPDAPKTPMIPALRRSEAHAAASPSIAPAPTPTEELAEPAAATTTPSPSLTMIPTLTRSSPREPAVAPPTEPPPAIIAAPAEPTPEPSAAVDQYASSDMVDPPPEPPADPKEPALDRLVSALVAGLDAGRELPLAKLRVLGERPLIRIAQLFPGSLDLPRGDLKSLPSASAHGPLLRLCIALGPRITPYILTRLDDPDANVRFYGALLFQELRAPEAILSLARLAFDDDRDVRTIAMRVLETYHRETHYPRAVAMIRAKLERRDPAACRRAIQALGTLRDVGALNALIELLDEDDLDLGAAALTSLCTLTGQHLGMRAERWRAWAQEHGGHPRIEWMIDSLGHRDPAVRRWAFEELLRITDAPIAFNPNGDEDDREAGIARWRAWWEEQRQGGG